MSSTMRARLKLVEKLLNPASKRSEIIYLINGRDDDNDPFEATAGERQWQSRPDETFEEFKARVLREAVGAWLVGFNL